MKTVDLKGLVHWGLADKVGIERLNAINGTVRSMEEVHKVIDYLNAKTTKHTASERKTYVALSEILSKNEPNPNEEPKEEVENEAIKEEPKKEKTETKEECNSLSNTVETSLSQLINNATEEEEELLVGIFEKMIEKDSFKHKLIVLVKDIMEEDIEISNKSRNTNKRNSFSQPMIDEWDKNLKDIFPYSSLNKDSIFSSIIGGRGSTDIKLYLMKEFKNPPSFGIDLMTGFDLLYRNEEELDNDFILSTYIEILQTEEYKYTSLEKFSEKIKEIKNVFESMYQKEVKQDDIMEQIRKIGEENGIDIEKMTKKQRKKMITILHSDTNKDKDDELMMAFNKRFSK